MAVVEATNTIPALPLLPSSTQSAVFHAHTSHHCLLFNALVIDKTNPNKHEEAKHIRITE